MKQDLLGKSHAPSGKGSCAGLCRAILGHELQTFPPLPLGFPAETDGGHPQPKGKPWCCILTAQVWLSSDDQGVTEMIFHCTQHMT